MKLYAKQAVLDRQHERLIRQMMPSLSRLDPVAPKPEPAVVELKAPVSRTMGTIDAVRETNIRRTWSF